MRYMTGPLSFTMPKVAVKEEGKYLNPPLPMNETNDGISAPRKNLPIAIIGAGVAGMRVAMMLDYLGLPYEIFEASGRHGGRCFTYHFTREQESGLKYDYFDVGAMRYPNNWAMKVVFDLFEELDITVEGGNGGKLLPFITNAPGNIRLFNGKEIYICETTRYSRQDRTGVKRQSDEVGLPGDHFSDSEVNQGSVRLYFILSKLITSNNPPMTGPGGIHNRTIHQVEWPKTSWS